MKEDCYYEHLPFFDFYDNLESMNIDDFQFMDNVKIKILHPYQCSDSKNPSEKIPDIKVSLSMCTLYKGRPNGLAKI
jgi:hypothetical protein